MCSAWYFNEAFYVLRLMVSSNPLKLDICKQDIESDYTKRDIAEGSARYIIINTLKS